MPNTVKASTKLLGLIGTPVNASMSPSMHNAAFEQLGIDAIYMAFDTNSQTVEKSVKGLASLGAIGYNVTVPLKQEVLQYLDEINEAAALMNSVNTVCVKNGKSIGYNTDGLSFTKTLKDEGVIISETIIAVADIGAEGPAYITQAAVEGAKKIIVLTNAESQEKAFINYSTLSEKTNCPISVYDINEIDAYKTDLITAQVFCNATRIGTGEPEDQSPIGAELLINKPLVLDTIYNPRVTKLMETAKECECKTIGGLTLLLNQASEAEKLWFDCEMPVEYIKEMFF